MFKYKTYVRILSLVLLSIVIGSFIYIYFYSKLYPIPLFHRISLDAKMKFLRDMSDYDRIDTLIVGSSIGLNNIQGIVLEDSSEAIKHVANISALGLHTTQVEQLSELFSLFPNVKRVIYSTQFEDWGETFLLGDNKKVDFAIDYIHLGKGTIDFTYSLYTFKHLIEFTKNHWKWEKVYAPNNTNYCSTFDRTGSVPLNMYGEDINHKMFTTPPVNTKLKKENFLALEKMIKGLQYRNIRFYLIAQPYRQYMIDNYDDVRIAREKFVQKTQEITIRNDGKFIDLHSKLQLSDDFFADREHLNSNGSAVITKEVAKFIDASE